MDAVRTFLWQAGRVNLSLFIADLESRFDQEKRDEHAEMLAEMLDAERGSISYAERLLAALGQPIVLFLRGGQRVAGTVRDVALQWVNVATVHDQCLIPLHSIVAASGLGPVAPDADSPLRRISIGHILREVSARYVPVVIEHDAGQHVGRIYAVYADHCDMLVGGRDSWDQRDRGSASVLSLSIQGVQKITLAGNWQG